MRLAAVALGALLVCMGGRAWADDAAAARDHAQKATTFYKLAKYDDAIREFEAAYEAKTDPALLYNIAQCHRLAGREGDALRMYRNYLKDAPRGPYRAQAEQWIGTLEKAVAEHATPTAPPEASGSVAPPVETAPPNGPAEPPPNGAAAPPVMPGPGPYPPAQTTPEAPAGPPASTIVLPPAQPPASPGHRTAGVVVASIGGAFVVGGVICGLVARAEAKKVEDAAAAHDAFDPSAEKTGRNAQTAQWIGYGVGAAGLAVGVILIVMSHPAAETAPQSRVALAPLAGPGIGGALMRVAF
jgi:tetratricopeptide (TPR) repeat protein